MSATITWSIVYMISQPQADGQTDVVINAGWACTGVQTANDKDYQSQKGGNSTFTYSGSSFTPYDQLTQDQVLGWVWASGVDKDETEAQVQTWLNEAINPPTVELPLPWSA